MNGNGAAIQREFSRRDAGGGNQDYDPWQFLPVQEFSAVQTAIARGLRHAGVNPRELRALDLGCGSGRALLQLRALGFQLSHLIGIDLSEDRLSRLVGDGWAWGVVCGDGVALPFPDGKFDFIRLDTVLSSVVTDDARREIASEIDRVSHDGTLLAIYDMRITRVSNRRLRRVTPKVVKRLFPNFSWKFRSMTVFPPVARRIGPSCPICYRTIELLRVLNSHFLGFGVKVGHNEWRDKAEII